MAKWWGDWQAHLALGQFQAFDNAFYADLDCDGVYETYATIYIGSGMPVAYIVGYDPAMERTATLNEGHLVEYSFVAYDELFVWVHMSPYMRSFFDFEDDSESLPMEGNPSGYYRPVLNAQTLTFDLEEIPQALSEEIAAAFGQS